MRISGIFLLCALPLVSAGWAWGVALSLARRDTEERRLYCFRTIRKSFNRRGRIFFLMGILDLGAVLLLAAAILTLSGSGVSFGSRAASAFFFWLNIVTLCSGMYRYPLAVYDKGLILPQLYLKGFMQVFAQPGQTILFAMTFISIGIVSVLAGLTLFLFLPGAAAILNVYIYRNLEIHSDLVQADTSGVYCLPEE